MKLLEAVALIGLGAAAAVSITPAHPEIGVPWTAQEKWVVHAIYTKENGDTEGFYVQNLLLDTEAECTKVITDRDFIDIARAAFIQSTHDSLKLECKTLDDLLHPKTPA